MNVANPIAFLWAGLLVPIVIFYILKIRMRRVPVSTVMFWEQIFEEKQPRSIWQRLRHWISLLLQLAFLLLLVLALTDPYFTSDVRNAQRWIVILDNSASMQAADVEPSRLESARAEADRLIDSLRPRDEMALIAAGTEPHVLCGLTGHQRTLRTALEGLVAGDGPTRVPQALELARRLKGDHPNATLVLLSDGGFEGMETLTQAEDVVWLPFGKRTGNVGITQFQVRRSLLDPVGYEVLVEIRNFSDESVETRLEIELENQVVDVVPLTLAPDERWSHVFEKTSAAGGVLLGRINRADALPADNAARAVLPARAKQRVLLVTEGNLFLQRVFEANPLVNLEVTDAYPGDVPPETLVVFHRNVPATVPAGNVFVIDPTNSTDRWVLHEKLESPTVARQDRSSPLMAHVRLDNVLMPEARRLTVAGEHQVVAEAVTGEPLYFSMEREGDKLAVLTVNLERGDLPLRTAFPILVSNALGWFAGTKGELRESLATGAVAQIALPETIQRALGSGGPDAELLLQSPDGNTRPLADADGSVTIGPLDQCGIWRIVWRRDARNTVRHEVPIACNLTNAEESDLRIPVGPSAPTPTLTAGIGGRPIWYYLVAAAWLMAGLEWFLYQRRWIS